VRSRVFMTTVLADLVGAVASGRSTVRLRFDVKRGLSLRCWIFGHEDWRASSAWSALSGMSGLWTGDTGVDNVSEPVPRRDQRQSAGDQRSARSFWF